MCRLSVLLFLIVIFCCNKKDSSYFNIEKFVGDTLVTNIKKSNNSIIDTVKNNQNTNFRLYPERDTFIVTHWYKSGDKWCVILLDGRDLYCDDVREIVE